MPKDKKKDEPDALIVAEEFKHRHDKKAAGGFLAVLLKRLGVQGSQGVAEGLRSLGADVVGSKSGFTALLLFGYSVAIGTGMVLKLTDGSGSTRAKNGIFQTVARSGPQDGESDVGAFRFGTSVRRSAPHTSLDYFQRANRNALGPEVSQDSAREAQEGDVPEADSGVGVPDNDWSEAGPAAGGKGTVSSGKLKLAMKKMETGGGSSGAKVSAAPGSARTAMSTGNGASKAMGTRSHGGVLARATRPAGRNRIQSASSQALQVRKTLRSSLSRGSVLTSQNSGTPYDGGRGSVNQIGETSSSSASAGPGASGDKSVTSKANAGLAKNLKSVQPPPDVKFPSNQTPYQNVVNMAMIALAAATGFMFMAGWLKNKADALLATDPPEGMKLMQNVKLTAGLATAAALGAVALGSQLLNVEGQNMQGLTFMTSGGIIAMRAGMILFDSMSAKKAQQDVTTATSGLIANEQMLKGGQYKMGGKYRLFD